MVFDLDNVLLGGDASVLFLRGRLRESPVRALPLMLAAPALVPGAVVPQLRPLAARAMTRIAVAGRAVPDAHAAADAYRTAVAHRPEAAVADALACARQHLSDGDRVVVATACEEILARGFLLAVGLGEPDVVGSTGSFRPPRVRRAIGEWKVRMLTERGYPPSWAAVYSDSSSDPPLFAGTPRPVLVNASPHEQRRVTRVLGREPETVVWK